MPAMEMLCYLAGINPCHLSKEENLILEVELFVQVCEELKTLIKHRYKNYFRLMKFNPDMEEEMLDARFISCVIKDILSTEEYTLFGMANYLQIPEEVITDIASGQNTNPSLILSRKIIDLHRSVRRDFYHEIIKKITTEHLKSA